MKMQFVALILTGLALAGCGRSDDVERAAQSMNVNTPNGPLVLGFWPGEPRKFALEKARALTNGSMPAGESGSRVVELPKMEVAKLPCVALLTFHEDRLLCVYIGFLTHDPAEIRRVREMLAESYGPPKYTKSASTFEFQQWIVKKPLPFTVVSGTAQDQLFYVSCYDDGPLFRSALPSITANHAADQQRIKELAKKNGL